MSFLAGLPSLSGPAYHHRTPDSRDAGPADAVMTERVYRGIMLTSGAFLALMGVYLFTDADLLV